MRTQLYSLLLFMELIAPRSLFLNRFKPKFFRFLYDAKPYSYFEMHASDCNLFHMNYLAYIFLLSSKTILDSILLRHCLYAISMYPLPETGIRCPSVLHGNLHRTTIAYERGPNVTKRILINMLQQVKQWLPNKAWLCPSKLFTLQRDLQRNHWSLTQKSNLFFLVAISSIACWTGESTVCNYFPLHGLTMCTKCCVFAERDSSQAEPMIWMSISILNEVKSILPEHPNRNMLDVRV